MVAQKHSKARTGIKLSMMETFPTRSTITGVHPLSDSALAVDDRIGLNVYGHDLVLSKNENVS